MEITVFKKIAKWMGKKEDFLKLLRLEELEEEWCASRQVDN